MDELLSEFLTETAESLSALDVELVRLEQNPNDTGLLSNIFRLVHTIKGTCGFLGLPRLESVAHASENVLGKFRDGEMEVTAEAITVVLASLDRIKSLLAALEATEAEPEGDDSELIAALDALAAGEAVTIAPPVQAAPPPPHPAPAEAEDRPATEDELEAAFRNAPGPADMAPVEEPAAAPAEAPAASAEPSLPAPAASRSLETGEDARESAVAAQSIRVSVDLLENLMTMVSELVLTRNQLLQIVRRFKDSEFTVPLQRLSQVTSELQEGVMKTRMQPIGNAWAKLPRIVRDLAVELNKKIDLQMIGADTELDRQVLELIKDPLTHMVRNSADHGIERPHERVGAGKPETGRITLNAYHEGGHIIIDISDDGRGIDPAKIKQKALRLGLATESELEAMSDQQVQQFIFRAGFSTAEKVTSVSGRGVGMDVVRTNIEKIGGTIELKSQSGKGSKFIIKIPLTLAIVSALIVEACGERFAIPQISVIELVRASGTSEHRIETIQGTPVLRLRNRLLPLVSLERLLHLERTEAVDARDTFIVVAQVGTYTFGIMVDRVFDTEEIVVKPVAPILRHISMFSGNTILGDGSVIMILDPNGIASATGEITIHDAARHEAAKSVASSRDRVSLLVFRAGASSPKAVPLSLVARLEEIDLAKIEYTDGRPLVQYRGKLMPLVPMVEGQKIATEGRQPVLVFADGERSMGLIVDEIVDIVEDRINVELKGERQGLMGSAVVAGKATDVIDAGYYLSLAFPDWFGSEEGGSREASQARRVLLVDDSPFFRNLLSPVLSVAGYQVTTVAGAREALRLCEDGGQFDAIVTDIEMPEMSGFELAESLKSSERWRDVPVVALSSHTTPRYVERGRQVGFADYVAKFDRDGLLQTLSETIPAS